MIDELHDTIIAVAWPKTDEYYLPDPLPGDSSSPQTITLYSPNHRSLDGGITDANL